MTDSDALALVAWLRTCLDQDEALALAVADPARIWVADSSWFGDLLDPLPSQRREHPGYLPMLTEADVAHIAAHDPARVLKEVAMKRKLLYQFEHRGNSVRATVQPSTGGVWDDLLRMLAEPYSDRPGYLDSWRPS